MAGAASAAAVGLALGGCLSPTLPVPPPEPLALQEPLASLLADAKQIRIDGAGAASGALVAMWNEEVQDGTLARADDKGLYRALLVVNVSCSRPQNHIQLWQTDMDGNSSKMKTYRLPNSFSDVTLPPDDGAAGCGDAGSADVDTVIDAEGGGAE